MDLALIIAVVALAVAIPGTIDATWNVITKLRALKKGDSSGPSLLKKSEKLRLDGVSRKASQSLRKSKKEVTNAMRLMRRVALIIFNGGPSGPKKKKAISQEDVDETLGVPILKKSFMRGIYA